MTRFGNVTKTKQHPKRKEKVVAFIFRNEQKEPAPVAEVVKEPEPVAETKIEPKEPEPVVPKTLEEMTKGGSFGICSWKKSFRKRRSV